MKQEVRKYEVYWSRNRDDQTMQSKVFDTLEQARKEFDDATHEAISLMKSKQQPMYSDARNDDIILCRIVEVYEDDELIESGDEWTYQKLDIKECEYYMEALEDYAFNKERALELMKEVEQQEFKETYEMNELSHYLSNMSDFLDTMSCYVDYLSEFSED